MVKRESKREELVAEGISAQEIVSAQGKYNRELWESYRRHPLYLELCDELEFNMGGEITTSRKSVVNRGQQCGSL
jgi:hypothetical protein